MSPRERNQLLHGTLDTLILKVLSYGPRHGYAVARWLEEETRAWEAFSGAVTRVLRPRGA